jgi:hypothetical protein
MEAQYTPDGREAITREGPSFIHSFIIHLFMPLMLFTIHDASKEG